MTCKKMRRHVRDNYHGIMEQEETRIIDMTERNGLKEEELKKVTGGEWQGTPEEYDELTNRLKDVKDTLESLNEQYPQISQSKLLVFVDCAIKETSPSMRKSYVDEALDEAIHINFILKEMTCSKLQEISNILS